MVESEKRIGVPFDLIVDCGGRALVQAGAGHWERFFETTTAAQGRHVHVGASALPRRRARDALGLKTVWISRGGADVRHTADAEPDRELPDLSGLPDALDELVRGVTLRPPREDEFDAMLELMNAHQLAAFGEADVTADELRPG